MPKWSQVALIAALAAMSLTTGCATGGSMQVDVEVYRGPLSKEPAAQWQELSGLVQESRLAFRRTFLSGRSATLQGFQGAENPSRTPTDPEDCRFDGSNNPSNDSDSKRQACFNALQGELRCHEHVGSSRRHCNDALAIVFAAWRAQDSLQASYQGIQTINKLLAQTGMSQRFIAESGSASAHLDPQRSQIQRVLEDLSRIGLQLQSNAFITTSSELTDPEVHPVTQPLRFGYTMLAAEMGNQISARADALLKQMHGNDRRLLPISVYLRDTAPTAFLNLHVYGDQTRGTGCRMGQCMGRQTARNRIRSQELLWADHHWARINQVYASGRGDVNMAFIKDDIGNWSLKSFGSDPSELLNSYEGFGRSLIGAASTLLTSANPTLTEKNLSLSKRTLSYANRVAFGTSSGQAALEASSQAESLTEHLITQIQALRVAVTEELAELDKALPQQTTLVDSLQRSLDALDAELEDLDPRSNETLQEEIAREGARLEELQASIDRLSTDLQGTEEEQLRDVLQSSLAAEEVRREQKSRDLDQLRSALAARQAKSSELRERDKVAQGLAEAKEKLQTLQARRTALPATTRQRTLDLIQAHRDLLDRMEMVGQVTGDGQ